MLKNNPGLSIGILFSFLLSAFFIWKGLQPQKLDIFRSQTQTSKSLPSISPLGQGKAAAPAQKNLVNVLKVIDGDTIEVATDKGTQKLRYIGIDTPETVDPRRSVGCFGHEASNENKRLVEGRQVILEKDISETDKFGRILRFVYLPLDDGSLLFVNDYLVRNGFALASTYPPDVKLSGQFVLAQKEAVLNNRGLWKNCPKK